MGKKQHLDKLYSLADRAFECLPEELSSRIDNLEIIVDDESQELDLLGLYEGVPLTDRGMDYFGMLPDRITLFARAIETTAREDGLTIYEVVRTTLLHEIAHHFGIDDDRLDELGWA
ncbi:MAG: metallopeptidase family protein [Actinomycetota bacterium]